MSGHGKRKENLKEAGQEQKSAAAPGQVTLWWAGTGAVDEPEPVQDILSEAEKAKCGRYKKEEDRAACRASRLLCRRALSPACGQSPGELVFGEGPNGKPMLLDEGGNPHRLRFNLSHSHDLIVLAASTETEVGADVEKITPGADTSLIARRFFSPDEALTLSSLSGRERLERFLGLWTLKEAAMKALGGGIFLGLAGIRFSFRRDGSLGFSLAEGFPEAAQNLDFALFEPCPGYLAAVAAFGGFSVKAFKAAAGGGFEPAVFTLAASTPGFLGHAM